MSIETVTPSAMLPAKAQASAAYARRLVQPEMNLRKNDGDGLFGPYCPPVAEDSNAPQARPVEQNRGNLVALIRPSGSRNSRANIERRIGRERPRNGLFS